MRVEAVSDEVLVALASITGLRLPPWGVKQIQPPAATVALPERIEYDATYKAATMPGVTRIPDLPVWILVGAADSRTARERASKYADGTGTDSVKRVLEAYAFTTCDFLHVKWSEFQEVEYADTPLLAVIFHCDVVGTGN